MGSKVLTVLAIPLNKYLLAFASVPSRVPSIAVSACSLSIKYYLLLINTAEADVLSSLLLFIPLLGVTYFGGFCVCSALFVFCVVCLSNEVICVLSTRDSEQSSAFVSCDGGEKTADSSFKNNSVDCMLLTVLRSFSKGVRKDISSSYIHFLLLTAAWPLLVSLFC